MKLVENVFELHYDNIEKYKKELNVKCSKIESQETIINQLREKNNKLEKINEDNEKLKEDNKNLLKYLELF